MNIFPDIDRKSRDFGQADSGLGGKISEFTAHHWPNQLQPGQDRRGGTSVQGQSE